MLSIPVRLDFTFQYGLGSFKRHEEQVVESGLPCHIFRSPDTCFDVDHPEDLERLITAAIKA